MAAVSDPLAVSAAPSPSPDRPCRRCDHALSDHCKGQVSHGYHKEDMWPAEQRTRTVICHTRHCNLPICSCVDFVEQENL
jgi:hypothetical protein